MTALAAGRGRNGLRGGAHGLSAVCGGACHESAGSHSASPGRAAHVDSGGGHSRLQSAHDPTAALAVATRRLWGAVRSAAPPALAETGTPGPGPAAAGPPSRTPHPAPPVAP